MGVVVGVLGLFAVVAWVLAVISAINIVRLTPKGQRLTTYWQLGWWRFDDIRNRVGPEGDGAIRTYQRAFLAFFLCVLASMVIGGLLSVTAQS